KGLDDPTIVETGADRAADTAMEPCPGDTMVAAELFKQSGHVAIGPEPHGEDPLAGRGRACRPDDRPEQLEIGLRIRLG
ncbi:hypothetical protein ABTK05_22110, partial [Acinetobacter baumannii]